MIADENDREGGISVFHTTCRRVVLTDVFVDGAPTGFTVQLAPEAKGAPVGTMHLGPGWDGNDLDPSEHDGLAVLAGAALLYEEIWVPLTLATATIRLLGVALFERLVGNEKLRLWTLPHHIGFIYSNGRDGDRWGSVSGLSSPQRPPDADLRNWVKDIARVHREPRLEKLIFKAVRPLTGGTDRCNAVMRETEEDLRQPRIRRLLGISEHPEQIPLWDAVLANRILHLNTAIAIADQVRADVVEFEGGLSRIATEKFFSNMRFDRLYPTSAALDGVMRVGGLPDVGSLVRHVGREQFFAACDGPAAQAFRDWFWDAAGCLVGSGADMRSQFADAVSQVLPIDATALGVLGALKLRFIQQGEDGPIVGAPYDAPPLIGFAARVSRADSLLKTQARNHFDRRRRRIAELLGREPETYDQCPCRSGAKYKFCCGARG